MAIKRSFPSLSSLLTRRSKAGAPAAPALANADLPPTRAKVGSFIRTTGDELDATPSAVGLRAAVEDEERFLDEWLARHFSVSVKLFDLQLRKRRDDGDTDAPFAARVQHLEAIQGVLFELREMALADDRARDLMAETRLVQNAVIAVYGWLDDAIARVARGEAVAAPGTSLGDIVRLTRAEDIPGDRETAQKIALCFRQASATIATLVQA